MKLLIDVGNSRIKSALHRDGEINAFDAVESADNKPPSCWSTIDRPDAVFVSSVAGPLVDKKITEWVENAWGLKPRFAAVRENAAGVRTSYEDPSKLGVDRWLAAIAGYELAGNAACVVDAGTALTIDIIDGDGVHLGGSISPGLALMVSSLSSNTAQLSLDEIAISNRIATNTAEAISGGCIDAVVGGIELMRRRLQDDMQLVARWFITGGGAPVIISRSTIEFTHVPDLVLRGLLLAENAS